MKGMFPLWSIPAFPLASSALLALLGGVLPRRAVHLVAVGSVGAAFALAAGNFFVLAASPSAGAVVEPVFSWISAGDLRIDATFRFDALSAVLALVVTGVGFLIHLYSTGYMAEDPDPGRYFCYLNLFTGLMLVLVLADNLPLLFVGWEGVGLCSYLLIGFWYEDPEKARAGRKAFVVNRVGDAGFLLGIFLLFWHLGGGALSFSEIEASLSRIPEGVAAACALLLFLGATGKSAQIPLYVWLPDAMAGPTPVSALIHAATMVTAGVYMVARLHFLYAASAWALPVVAVVGAVTALFAATMALVETDIKKVLAYSTISQLGYMFLGVGVGAFSAGIFHLVTHAFFKALLFLAAGSVIHGLGGEQDIRKMGGLRSSMPLTFATFSVGVLAISGIPGFSGFFSKDEILLASFAREPALWALAWAGAALTAFYMGRLWFVAFFGRGSHGHECPASMALPLVILALLSVFGGYVGLPESWLWGNPFARFLEPVTGVFHPHLDPGVETALFGLSSAAGVGGLLGAYVFYVARPAWPEAVRRRWSAVHSLLRNKYYVDEAYDRVVVRPTVAAARRLWTSVDTRAIDGAVNGVARVCWEAFVTARRWQSGNVQHYALSVLVGAVVILGFYAWAGGLWP
ncbi:MAG: NADH-quinone oxidoreductase subunit L [Candidatus Binatia bacterium]|nr:MAG: NADH-quinone oxidoreductase subunit L [Candidatus Binatia bacterium]